MSTKSITRVAIFLVISLVLVAATTMSVRGWFAGTDARASGVSGAHVYVLGPLTSDVAQSQPAISGVQDKFSEKDSGHHCESEAFVSPDD